MGVGSPPSLAPGIHCGAVGGQTSDNAVAKEDPTAIGRWWGVVRPWGLGRITRVTAEVLVSGSAQSGFGRSEVGGIAFNVEDHVTGMIVDCCIGMHGAVIEELG